MKLRLALLFVFALGMATVPAVAQVDLYDNGPTNGTVDAWTINFGFEVSDQFTLTSAAQVNGLQFSAWLFPGDVLESVDVLITTSEFGGVTLFNETLNVTQSGCAVNQLAFNVCNENVTFSSLGFNAGSYWLNLGNAIVNSGNPVYWDENDGPSRASEGSIGSIPSESFTILGASSTTSTTSTTPEPGTLILFGSAALGFVGFLGRRSGF
jgi:PEP-CTERM motif